MIREERALLDCISKTNRLHGLFREGDSVLLALSGGPDSAALAGLFSIIGIARRLRLFAIHLNHGLSRQAPAFERTARQIAERFAIPFYRDRVDVAARARRLKISLEEAGRQARYDCFVRRARRLGVASLATAHTSDDQVETILFRIFRGTSLRGLAGIPYARDERGMRVIRPLLDCSKAELAAYAAVRKIPFRKDRSNRSARHTRNRLRHELLPLLETRFNPRVREAVVRLQQSWLEWSPLVTGTVDRAWSACGIRRGKGRLSLDQRIFLRLDNVLKQEIFLRAAEAVGAGRKALGRVHAEAARSLPDRPGRPASHFPDFTVSLAAKRLVWQHKGLLNNK